MNIPHCLSHRLFDNVSQAAVIGIEQDMAASRQMMYGPISTTERRKQFQKLKMPPASSPQLVDPAANSDMDATAAYHAMASNNHPMSHLL